MPSLEQDLKEVSTDLVTERQRRVEAETYLQKQLSAIDDMKVKEKMLAKKLDKKDRSLTAMRKELKATEEAYAVCQ